MSGKRTCGTAFPKPALKTCGAIPLNEHNNGNLQFSENIIGNEIFIYVCL